MTPHALIAPARLAGIPLLRTQSDERLVDLVRAGNESAFEAIVARYRRPLLRYCAGLLTEERAEDAVQQTFMRAYDSLRASNREMQLRAWLYRIAHNTALNVLRDGGRPHEQLTDLIDGVERPDQAYERSQRLREVVSSVERLPERQRDALVLRELEGRSYEEIAVSLGVSDGAVRQLLNRARTTLRAGATAVTPLGLLARVPWVAGSGDGMAVRLSELCGGAAGGAVLTKVCATALVTGAVFGGVATAPDDGDESSARPAITPAAPAAVGAAAGAVTPAAADRVAGLARGEDGRSTRGRRGRGGEPDRSGRRAGEEDSSSSGPGAGSEGPSSNSGPGSGSGSGGSGTSGSGGSGASGSGTSGSGGSGSGSGSSGSTDTLAGSGGASGSGTSGSGTSGSGTSGSGSGTGDSGSGSSGSG